MIHTVPYGIQSVDGSYSCGTKFENRITGTFLEDDSRPFYIQILRIYYPSFCSRKRSDTLADIKVEIWTGPPPYLHPNEV
jgi:hypothetical protein